MIPQGQRSLSPWWAVRLHQLRTVFITSFSFPWTMHPYMIWAPSSPIFLQTLLSSAVLQPSSGAFFTTSRTYQAYSYHRVFGNLFFWVISSLYSDFCSDMTPRDFTNYVCLFFVFFIFPLFLLIFLVFFCYFETVSYHVALLGLELTGFPATSTLLISPLYSQIYSFFLSFFPHPTHKHT